MTTMTTEPRTERKADPDTRPHLRRGENGGVTFLPPAGGEPIHDCRVARCFPWSLPSEFFSVRDKDGNELHLFDTLQDVPEDSRDVLIEELAAEEFVPQIRSIREIDDTFEILIWKAQTDRGPVEFQVKDDEDIRLLEDNSVVIKDHAGMLFEIPDLAALDETSRALVEDRLS